MTDSSIYVFTLLYLVTDVPLDQVDVFQGQGIGGAPGQSGSMSVTSEGGGYFL